MLTMSPEGWENVWPAQVGVQTLDIGKLPEYSSNENKLLEAVRELSKIISGAQMHEVWRARTHVCVCARVHACACVRVV